jgi:hypothetical protein
MMLSGFKDLADRIDNEVRPVNHNVVAAVLGKDLTVIG